MPAVTFSSRQLDFATFSFCYFSWIVTSIDGTVIASAIMREMIVFMITMIPLRAVFLRYRVSLKKGH